MKVGDRVRHKRFGLGEVQAVYDKYAAARVRYDSGKESTNAILKLEVQTVGQGAGVVTSTISKPVKRKSASSSQVDYETIDRAVAAAREMYPEADEVVGKWYGTRAYAEVWKDNAAKIIFYREES